MACFLQLLVAIISIIDMNVNDKWDILREHESHLRSPGGAFVGG
jgi:hypothetical protein